MTGPGHAKTCLTPYANNKGADQPAHPRSLISTFVVRCLNSMICILAIAKVSRFYLGSVADQAGLNLTWSKIPEDTFLHDMGQLTFKSCNNVAQLRCHAYKRCRPNGKQCRHWSDSQDLSFQKLRTITGWSESSMGAHLIFRFHAGHYTVYTVAAVYKIGYVCCLPAPAHQPFSSYSLDLGAPEASYNTNVCASGTQNLGMKVFLRIQQAG